MPDAPAPVPYMPATDVSPKPPVEQQPFDRGAQWVLGILALMMTIPFAAGIPLVLYAMLLHRDRVDLLLIVALLAAIGMTIGLGGAGIGMIRRARRAPATPPDQAQP